MKKIYISLILVVFVLNSVSGQITTIVNGQEREYLVFTPLNRHEDPRAMFLLLHGNGGTAQEFATLCNAQLIADLTDFIVVFPQALDEQNLELVNLISMLSSLGGIEFPGVSVEGVWNAGVSVSNSDVIPASYMSLMPLIAPGIAAAGKIQFNKDVDDIAYLNQVINEVKRDYNIDESRIFMEGASMGGAMTYRYAYNGESQVSAIAVAAGFIGAEVDDSEPLDIPVCIFHSQDDEVVPYNGSFLNGPIPEIVEKITSLKNCSDGVSSDLPDIADDGITIEKIQYECNSSYVWFYKITGASHIDFLSSDYQTGPNDIDYLVESYRFFMNLSSTDIEDRASETKDLFFPNPAGDFVISSVSGTCNIYNMAGEQVISRYVDEDDRITVSGLPAGLYVVKVKTEQGVVTGKLVKK
jgi:poly(3-hydroxybutyrate) depolymerase